MSRTWQYFDFDKYWEIFKDGWSMPNSQTVLRCQMNQWCQAYNPKIALWQYTKTKYWETKIKRQIAKDAISNNCLIQYKRTMQNILLIKYNDNTTLLNCYVEKVYKNMYHEFKPQDGTIDSFILQNGQNCIAPVLFETAIQLYPDTMVKLVKDMNDNDVVLIPEYKLVFDLLGFYHFQHDHDPSHSVFIDSCYDMILDGFQSLLSLEDVPEV